MEGQIFCWPSLWTLFLLKTSLHFSPSPPQCFFPFYLKVTCSFVARRAWALSRLWACTHLCTYLLVRLRVQLWNLLKIGLDLRPWQGPQAEQVTFIQELCTWIVSLRCAKLGIGETDMQGCGSAFKSVIIKGKSSTITIDSGLLSLLHTGLVSLHSCLPLPGMIFF